MQAAGKTTVAKSLTKHLPTIARVNKDDLRQMLFGEGYKLSKEPVVKACEKACAEVCLKQGFGVVVDDTNLTGETTWKDLAKEVGVKYTSLDLNISVEEAIRRDSQREKPVGAIAIRAIAARAGIK